MIGSRKYLAYFGFLTVVLCTLFTAGVFAAPDSSGQIQNTVSEADAEKALDRMALLAREEKWQELLNEFKDVDFSAWTLAGDAFYYRGLAYKGLKQADNAEKTFKIALQYSPKEAWFWYNLAELYDKQLNKDVEAAKAYKNAAALEDRSGWMPIAATLRAVNIYLSRVEPDAALEVLKQYTAEDLEKLKGKPRSSIFQAYGKTYAAQGREAEAWAAFRGTLPFEDEK